MGYPRRAWTLRGGRGRGARRRALPPDFRPVANRTRGPRSTIGVGAAGRALRDPSGGSCADGVPGPAFYPCAETAACPGVGSVYDCGGAGEPCDAGRRPYFRQYNNATRGQIAKVIYGALTGGPDCGPRQPARGRSSP